jgi:hypothetical protein
VGVELRDCAAAWWLSSVQWAVCVCVWGGGERCGCAVGGVGVTAWLCSGVVAE